MQRFVGRIDRSALCLVVLASVLLQPASAADRPRATVGDVALSESGALLGQVLDQQGTAKKDVPVMLRSGNESPAFSKTDAQGRFAFEGARGGVYRLTAAQSHGTYRLWAPGTAPPSAQRGVLIIAGRDLVRGVPRLDLGLYPLDYAKFWMVNPYIASGVAATAAAVPVGIYNSKDDGAPKSP